MIVSVDFRPFVQERQRLSLSVFISAEKFPSEKGSTLKVKVVLPKGPNSFRLGPARFSKENSTHFVGFFS